MQHLNESQLFSQVRLSDEEHQLIKMHQLGKPLGTYRLQAWYRFLLIGVTLFMCIMALFMLILIVKNSEQLFRGITHFTLIISALLVVLISALICFSCISFINERKMRLVVCEDGFLQMKKLWVRNRVDIVYWNEVADIRKEHFLMLEHQLFFRERKEPFTLFYAYENYNGLLALINEIVNERIELDERVRKRAQFKKNMLEDRAYRAKYGEWPDWLTEEERHWYETHPEES